MTRNILLLPLFFLFGCGDTPVTGDEGGTDATTMQDTSKPDTGSKDDGSASDAGKDSADDGSIVDDGGIIVDGGGLDSGPDGGQCQSANDCKLFSSYCSQNPCKCIPLGKNDPNPQCMGMMVTCFVDPCLNKTAFCNNGTCDVQ